MRTEYEKMEGYLPGNDNMHWGQSYYYNFYDPHMRVGALLRIGLLENKRETNTWCIFLKDGLPVFARTNINLPYTQDRPSNGIEVAGMRVRALEPLKKTQIDLTTPDFSADLVWDEMYPMEDCVAMSQNEEGSFARELANVHLEGPCRVTGHIVLRGERINVSGTGFRDISVGPRNWDAMLHHRTAWPVFENGFVFAGGHIIMANSRQSTYLSMFHDSAKWHRVKRIDDNHVWAEDGLSVNSAQWRFVDELDREFEFTVRPLSRWLFPIDTFVLCEQISEFQLADGTLGYGLFETSYRLPWKHAIGSDKGALI